MDWFPTVEFPVLQKNIRPHLSEKLLAIMNRYLIVKRYGVADPRQYPVQA